ncbi:putative peptidase M48 [Dioscorea sansibarensis]
MNFLRKSFPFLRRRCMSSKIPSPKPHPPPLLVFRSISNPNLYSTKRPFSAGRISSPFSHWCRFYHLYQGQPRKHWYHSPQTIFLIIVLGGGVIVTIYYGHFETVPCTKRSHFILLSPSFERKLGERRFQEFKNAHKGKILPANHPDSVRVRLISNNIIEALHRGHHHVPNPEKSKETRKKAASKAESSRSVLQHMEGLNWEVLVVRDNTVNAVCLPGGKIVVFTGLLDHFRTDAEIATVLGHEVAHVSARHGAERVTKKLWFAVIRLILLEFFDMPNLVDAMSTLLLERPFSRRYFTLISM